MLCHLCLFFLDIFLKICVKNYWIGKKMENPTIFIISRFWDFVKLYFFKNMFRELCAVVKTYRSLYSRNDKVTSVIHPSICRRNKTEIG